MSSKAEIARGWDLFRSGALAEAEPLILEWTHDVEAVRLLLWIAIRRGDVDAKQRYGEMLSMAKDVSLAAVGRAHENVALATLGAHMKPWSNGISRWAQAEIAYARALCAFINDQGGALREELSLAPPQTIEQRVRYAQLRAWAKALDDDFVGQANLLSHALTIALANDVDRTLTAIVAGSLALILREVDLDEINGHVVGLLERVEWPVDHSQYVFYAQWGLAWARATSGDWIQAMRLLDAALLSAPDAIRQGLIHADRARISATIGETVAARSARQLTFDYFSKIDWREARDDEAIVAMSVIPALAPEREQARALFDSAVDARVSKIIGAGHGKRMEAFRNFALAHLIDGDDGLRCAHIAYRLFKPMKYVHRATDCAMRAVELGGGVRWRLRVERLVGMYPRSLSARDYERSMSPVRQIRGRRREVMDLLATTDFTAKEIGATLGIAESTVHVHVKQIKKILGVENRSHLVRVYLEENPDARSAVHAAAFTLKA